MLAVDAATDTAGTRSLPPGTSATSRSHRTVAPCTPPPTRTTRSFRSTARPARPEPDPGRHQPRPDRHSAVTGRAWPGFADGEKSVTVMASPSGPNSAVPQTSIHWIRRQSSLTLGEEDVAKVHSFSQLNRPKGNSVIFVSSRPSGHDPALLGPKPGDRPGCASR